MRKKIISFIINFLLPVFLMAQQGKKADSLLLRLSSASDDTTKAQALTDLGFYYQESDRDSTLHYSNELMSLAEKMKNPAVKITAILLKAYAFYHKGNLLGSYQLSNEGLEIIRNKETKKITWAPALLGIRSSPEEHKKSCESVFTMYLAFTYAASGNTDKSIDYYKQSIEISTPLNNKITLLASYMNLGGTYASKNKPDSALAYSTKALQYSIALGEKRFRGVIFTNIGDIYFLKEQLDSAQYYYVEGLSMGRQGDYRYVEIQSLLGLARYFEKKQQPDSMLFYARDAFRVSDAFQQFSTKVEAAELIARALVTKGNIDSAYNYLSISKNIGDSLSKEKDKKRKSFQSFNFEEQLRLEKAVQENITYRNRIRTIVMIAGIGILSLLAWVFYRNSRRKQKDNKVLESALTNLKATQTQLIQSEKMASLGELTAGIAHEIQNPLNFVNNFSEVSNELIDEMNIELDKGDIEEAKAIAADVKQNLEKINHHGKRADAIVKGMLQHSRSSNGIKELTDINALCDEYLRLCYHGLRAKDKSFNATIKTDFDESLEKVNIIPQDIGRVILNILTNAFYAAPLPPEGGFLDPAYKHEPTVWVSTKKIGDKVEIKVRDNGPGIPQKILDKIFQPFFTTKPTGQGTGLGLSLSYDIVKAHGGELKVETVEEEGSAFTIQLPIIKNQ